jgi:hypothetical protein
VNSGIITPYQPNSKTRLEDKVTVLDTITAQQRNHPDYSAELSKGIVDAELRLLAAECRRFWEKSSYPKSLPMVDDSTCERVGRSNFQDNR